MDSGVRRPGLYSQFSHHLAISQIFRAWFYSSGNLGMGHRQEGSEAVMSRQLYNSQDLLRSFSVLNVSPSPEKYACSLVMDFVLVTTTDLQWLKTYSLGKNGFPREQGIDRVISGESSDNGIDWKDWGWGWRCNTVTPEPLLWGSLSSFYSIAGNFTLLGATLAFYLVSLILAQKRFF